MSEETSTTEQEPAVEAADTSTSTATKPENSTGDENQAHMIPKSRFDEVNEKLKTLEGQLAERDAKDQEAEQKRLEEQGKWQQIAEAQKAELESLKPAAEQLTALYDTMLKDIEAEVEDWPEEVQALMPPADDPQARISAMPRLRPLVAKLTATPAPTGTRKNPQPVEGSEDKKKAQARFARQVRSL